MGRIKNGWEITKESLTVIKKDKEILIFPVLSTILTIIIGAVILFFGILGGLGTSAINESLGKTTFYFFLAVFILASYFISIFFQAAIITSASIRFSGKNPSFTDGIKGPTKRVHTLFIWALISAVVGTLLNMLRNAGRNRSRGVQIASQATSGILKTAWGLLTFFTVPIILFENLSAFSSIKRSWELFKKTWGENVTAQFSIAGIFFLFALISIPFLFLAFFIGIPILIIISIGITIIYITILIVTATSVNGILKTALYLYATTGKMPSVYAPQTTANLFAKKTKINEF